MGEPVTQKEFYEAMAAMTKTISDLTNELTKTKTLIRDYNGLREKINDHDDRIQSVEDNKNNKKEYREYMGWIIGLISTLLAILSQFN